VAQRFTPRVILNSFPCTISISSGEIEDQSHSQTSSTIGLLSSCLPACLPATEQLAGGLAGSLPLTS